MKTFVNNKANIITKKIEKVFNYKDAIVLKVNIEYPYITIIKDYNAQNKINGKFRNVANILYSYAVTTLLPNAIEQYDSSIEHDYPFNPYESFMRYTVTLNDDCMLSTYYDQYEYTGGAHGITIRLSNTFNLQTGNILTLKDFFKNTPNYIDIILKEIENQADENISKNAGIYFANYKKLIIENFNEDYFYITKSTIDFYYQQYDIAPYATGIVVFSIPYEKLEIKKPHCIKILL